eukprot:contig_13225_g3155
MSIQHCAPAVPVPVCGTGVSPLPSSPSPSPLLPRVEPPPKPWFVRVVSAATLGICLPSRSGSMGRSICPRT